MTDRIADPWGGRTPFEQGEDWPIRVDQFLEEGVTEEEVDRWVQTASILHSNALPKNCLAPSTYGCRALRQFLLRTRTVIYARAGRAIPCSPLCG